MQTPRFWREIDERYTLKGVRCGNCETIHFPGRTLCPNCRHASVGRLLPYKLSGKGTIEQVTVVHSPPAGFELQAPYLLALVQLDEGPKVTAQVVDAKPEQIQPGTKVRAVFRRINAEGEAGVIHYGYKFVVCAPVSPAAAKGPTEVPEEALRRDPAMPKPRDIVGSGPAG